MRPVHLLGLALWRGGIVLAAGYVVYLALRAVLTITDTHLELGVAVTLTGLLFVLASVIAERIEDARSEGSQRQ